MKGDSAMSDDPGWDGLDRRDFITAAIGASAALASGINPANAQAAMASGGTVYAAFSHDQTPSS